MEQIVRPWNVRRRSACSAATARGSCLPRQRTDDFRAFTFENAVKLWGTQNPRFFEGTRAAKEAAAILAAAQAPTRAAADSAQQRRPPRAALFCFDAGCRN
ncbi:MAG: hypothetical protein ACREFH_16465 [Stellaceae bacterium]